MDKTTTAAEIMETAVKTPINKKTLIVAGVVAAGIVTTVVVAKVRAKKKASEIEDSAE